MWPEASQLFMGVSQDPWGGEHRSYLKNCSSLWDVNGSFLFWHPLETNYMLSMVKQIVANTLHYWYLAMKNYKDYVALGNLYDRCE